MDQRPRELTLWILGSQFLFHPGKDVFFGRRVTISSHEPKVHRAVCTLVVWMGPGWEVVSNLTNGASLGLWLPYLPLETRTRTEWWHLHNDKAGQVDLSPALDPSHSREFPWQEPRVLTIFFTYMVESITLLLFPWQMPHRKQLGKDGLILT